MANIFSQFIQDRFITPAIAREIGVSKDTKGFAVGATATPEHTLKDAIGQPHDTDYALLYSIFRLHPDVGACVKLWAGGATSRGWRIGLMDERDKPTPEQQKRIDEVTNWLKKPNPYKRFNSMLYSLIANQAVCGDAYLNKVKVGGRLRELWMIHPATMKIVATEHGEIMGYVQQAMNSHPVPFKPEEITHLSLPSITNDLYGHSPLEGSLESVRISLSAMRSNQAIFENGMSPSAVASINPELSKEQQQQAAEMIKAAHQGADKRHKLLIAPFTDFKEWGRTNKDMEFSQLMMLTTEQVANGYGVPKLFLNKKEAADFATQEAQERRFYNVTIKPLQDQTAETITEEVIHEIDPELAFYFNEPDFSDPNQLRTDALTLRQQDSRLIDANEMRSTYFGLPEKEELEDLEPIEDIQARQFEETLAAQSEQADSNGDDGEQEEGTEEATAAPKKKALTKALTPEQQRLISEREAILKDLTNTSEIPLSAFFQLMGMNALAADPTDIDTFLRFVMDGSNQALAAVMVPILYQSMQAGTQAAQLQLNMTLEFNRVNQYTQQYLEADALRHIQGINDTTRKALRATLMEGVGAGEGVDDLAARVQKVFTQASTHRARAIAATETAQAMQYANYQAAKASGVVTTRTWLTAPSDACPICQPLNGYTIRFDAKYPDNLEPSSAHVFCRCTEIYGEGDA